MPDWWAHSDALRDLLVELGRLPPPQRKFDFEEIQPGWLVYDNRFEPIGRICGQLDRYIVVQRLFHGFYIWLRLYIPEDAIGHAREGSVRLNIPRAWIGAMGWNRPPRLPPAAWRDH
ncbi:MAG: hypothetical protein ABSE70_00110 [Candidatus Limnocylindrales bacterium]